MERRAFRPSGFRPSSMIVVGDAQLTTSEVGCSPEFVGACFYDHAHDASIVCHPHHPRVTIKNVTKTRRDRSATGKC